MEIINQNVNEVEVGGWVACTVACASLCFVSYGSVTAMALALIAL